MKSSQILLRQLFNLVIGLQRQCRHPAVQLLRRPMHVLSYTLSILVHPLLQMLEERRTVARVPHAHRSLPDVPRQIQKVLLPRRKRFLRQRLQLRRRKLPRIGKIMTPVRGPVLRIDVVPRVRTATPAAALVASLPTFVFAARTIATVGGFGVATFPVVVGAAGASFAGVPRRDLHRRVEDVDDLDQVLADRDVSWSFALEEKNGECIF